MAATSPARFAKHGPPDASRWFSTARSIPRVRQLAKHLLAEPAAETAGDAEGGNLPPIPRRARMMLGARGAGQDNAKQWQTRERGQYNASRRSLPSPLEGGTSSAYPGRCGTAGLSGRGECGRRSPRRPTAGQVRPRRDSPWRTGRATTSVFGQLWVKTTLETRGYRTTVPCGTNHMADPVLADEQRWRAARSEAVGTILISLDLPSPRR